MKKEQSAAFFALFVWVLLILLLGYDAYRGISRARDPSHTPKSLGEILRGNS